MLIKVLTHNVKDASGKTVKVEPSVEITLNASDKYDKDMLAKFQSVSTELLQRYIDQALKQGLSPDKGGLSQNT